MQRYTLLPFAILVFLISPLVYLLSTRNVPSVLPNAWIAYFAILIDGPLLLIYGFIVYQFEQHRPLAWIAFIIGGLWTGYVYGWGTWKFFSE